MESNPVLHADSIGKSFGDRRVLSSASLVAHAGEIVGLLGRMGEGKSTLLRICAGLSGADSGWVKFRGEMGARPRLSSLAMKGLYFLPEMGSLADSLTVNQHFDMVRKRFRLGPENDVVERFQIGQFLSAKPSALSTGERRRVEIGLASFRSPLCLLADEPFRGLDPIAADAIGGALTTLADEGCAIVVTGHEVRTIVPFLTSVVWMTSGTIYALGHPDEASENEFFRREYLGQSKG